MNLTFKSQVEKGYLSAYNLLAISVFLFLLAGLFIPSSNPARWIFFLLIVPTTVYVVSKGYYTHLFTNLPFVSLICITLYLSLNSFFLPYSDTDASLQVLRRGFQIIVLVTAFVITSRIWLKSPTIHSRQILGLTLLTSWYIILLNWVNGDLSHRISGTGDFLSHPIEAPSVLWTIWVIGTFLAYTKPVRSPVDHALISAGVASLFLFTLLTQSRGPLITGVYSFTLLLLLSWKFDPPAVLKRYLLMTGGLLGSAILAIGFIPSVQAWMSSLATRSGTSFRPEIWTAVANHSGDAWLFGYGAATDFADTTVGNFIHSEYGRAFIHSHNLLTELYIIGGVTALLLTAAFLIICISNLLKSKAKGYPRLLAAFFIIGTVFMLNLTTAPRVISAVRADWIMLWLPVAFLVTYSAVLYRKTGCPVICRGESHD